MKRIGYLYEKFISEENWELAVKKAMQNKKSYHSVKRFVEKGADYPEKIRQEVINNTFEFKGYSVKKIYEPKERTLYISRFEERIFHWACMNIIIPIFEKCFFANSYACRKGKGQHKGSLKCAEMTRKYKYAVDIDARKFYPSINHDVLKRDLRKKIKDDKFLACLDAIIDSHDTGVPIGNYSSQIFGNIYMTKLDEFCNKLDGCKGVVRYCDNSILFFNDKNKARKAIEFIKAFYRDVLKMDMSKCELYPTSQGVDFVGYRCFKKTVLVRKRTMLRIKRRIRRISVKLENGCCNIKRAIGQVASALGWCKHASSGLTAVLLEMLDGLKQLAKV